MLCLGATTKQHVTGWLYVVCTTIRERRGEGHGGLYRLHNQITHGERLFFESGRIWDFSKFVCTFPSDFSACGGGRRTLVPLLKSFNSPQCTSYVHVPRWHGRIAPIVYVFVHQYILKGSNHMFTPANRPFGPFK